MCKSHSVCVFIYLTVVNSAVKDIDMQISFGRPYFQSFGCMIMYLFKFQLVIEHIYNMGTIGLVPQYVSCLTKYLLMFTQETLSEHAFLRIYLV